MRAGTLRHRISVERRVASKDERGQPTESWATRAELWASVQQAGGREREGTLAAVAEATWTVTVRGSASLDLRTTDRIRFRGRLLDVLAPPVDAGGRGIKLVIACKEHQPEGAAT